MTMPFYAGSAATAAAVDSLTPQIGISAGQTINSTTPAVISGFSFPVAATTYIVTAHVVIDANSGGTGEFRWTGPTTSLTLMTLICYQAATSTADPTTVESNSTGYNSGFLTTQAFGTTFYVCDLECTFTFSAAGTLALECANTTGSSNPFIVYPGSRVSVQQQVAT